jgi:hypothetical protein
MRNETKACILDKTEAARLCSAQTHRAVDDGLQYGLQVVRRTGDGAQHFRDSRLMRRKFGYLLLLL